MAIGVACAAIHTVSAKPADKWAELDAFKITLKAKLNAAVTGTASFDLEGEALKYGTIRVDGMAVCTSEEISPDQYIDLADINVELLKKAPAVAFKINKILEKGNGLSDCQYRVLVASIPRMSPST